MLHSAASEPISLFVKADQNVYKTVNIVIQIFYKLRSNIKTVSFLPYF